MISIVIVSMNKIEYVKNCILSIKKYTTVDYEIYLVAYLFSFNNLKILKNSFPEVKIIQSDEIRGFAENNNLALNLVKSHYTFVLNDDTLFQTDVLGKLVKSIEITKDASVISPVIYREDGSIQFSGRRRYHFLSFILEHVGIRNLLKSKYENGTGIFRTYNISGAAFLIKTEVFRKVGFFDEKYFFCPEDIALSTLLNETGHCCYVDANVGLIHYEGVSSKKTKLFYATTIAAYLGSSYFFGNSKLRRLILLGLWKSKYLLYKLINNIKFSKHLKDYEYIYRAVFEYYRISRSTKDVFILEREKV